MKKNKQQLIAEIRKNLGQGTVVNNFTDAEKFVKSSEDEQFIVVVTKKTIKQLKLSEFMTLEIN